MVGSLQSRFITFSLFVSAIILSIAFGSLAQAQQWNWQSPLPQGNALNDVGFIDGNTGYVIGGSGLVLETTDRGADWSAVEVGTTANLNRIFFATPDSGWIVGDGGMVFTTADGGMTWNAQTTPTTQNLYDVVFVDHFNGFAVGDSGTILRTINAGVQWTKLTTRSKVSLRGVSFVNTQFGCAVGYGGTVLNTIDHGDSWTSQVVDGNTNLYAVWFSSPDTGWVAGDYGNIWHTNDGTVTWAHDTSRTYERVNRITTVPGQYKIAACDGGNVITAGIGDSSWYSQTQPLTFANLHGVNVVADTGAFPYKTRFVGENGEILSSSNYGAAYSFTSLSPQTRTTLYSMCFTGATAGYAVGDSGIVYRTNNGKSWFVVQVSGLDPLRGIAFSPNNPAIGLAVGREGAVKWTKNNGNTWAQDTVSMLQGRDYNAVCFTFSGYCYMVGTGGAIYKYANNRWSAIQSPTKHDLYAVYFADDNYGFVAGQAGVVYKTKDGGATWTTQNANTTQDMYGIVVFRGATTFNGVDSVDATAGWIVGNTGLVRRTTDGGVTWLNDEPGSGGAFKSLHFTNRYDGVIAGANGMIYATKDGGKTWNTMSSVTQHNLNGIWLVNNSTGWAVGDSGTVLYNSNVALPVELASFTGWADGNTANLTWNTTSEIHSAYYQIERRQSNGNWQNIGTVTATGSVSQGASYVYADKGLSPNVYYYRLKEVDNDGSANYVGNTVELTVGSPAQVALYQNYPNPFNGTTGISFDLAKNASVNLVVTDIAGRIMQVLQDGQLSAGHYDLTFNAANLPAGAYIYKLSVDGRSYSHQMVVVK
ncbi:MAG TPA: YCF48-related protein [Candidatus Kapabacteria bacterium]|nr:YCF48-related protein [Candidatus Kapabacteria bacterium]